MQLANKKQSISSLKVALVMSPFGHAEIFLQNSTLSEAEKFICLFFVSDEQQCVCVCVHV